MWAQESDDPYWNDDTDDIAATYMGLGGDDKDEPDEALFQVPDTDTELVEKTKDWVDAVIADLGVCPFTVDKDRAGEPTRSGWSLRWDIGGVPSLLLVFAPQAHLRS